MSVVIAQALHTTELIFRLLLKISVYVGHNLRLLQFLEGHHKVSLLVVGRVSFREICTLACTRFATEDNFVSTAEKLFLPSLLGLFQLPSICEELKRKLCPVYIIST